MLPGDDRSEIDREVLDEPRVVTFWDGERTAGDWFGAHRVGGLGGGGYTIWDAFFAFDGSARWRAGPTGAVAAGSTIIGNTGALEQRFEPLLR